MKKRFKNKLYISTLAISLTGAFAGVATVALPSSSLSSSNNEISDISQQLNSSTVKATNSSLLAPWNIGSQKINNLNSPIQNMAFDNWNSQYALLTTSSTTYNENTYSIPSDENEMSVSYDSLSIFKMSDGTSVWTKKASELTVGSTAKGSSFVSVSYLSSYLNREAYYLAIIKGDDSKYYLAFLKESDGSVAISKQLNATSTTSNSFPQFYINVISSAKIIYVYKFIHI